MAEESTQKEGVKVCAQCRKTKPLKKFRYYKKSQKHSDNCLDCIGENIKAGQKTHRDQRMQTVAPAGSNGKLKIVVEIDIDTIVDEVTRQLSQKLAG